jgi:hypothetical protein
MPSGSQVHHMPSGSAVILHYISSIFADDQ